MLIRTSDAPSLYRHPDGRPKIRRAERAGNDKTRELVREWSSVRASAPLRRVTEISRLPKIYGGAQPAARLRGASTYPRERGKGTWGPPRRPRWCEAKENRSVADLMSVRSHTASMSAIEQVYRDRYEAFLRTASAIANSREAGRDAVHDAFVAALRAREGYRGEGSIEAWLWTMVIRSASKLRRSDQLEAAGPEPIFSPESAGPDAVVRAAVAALPEKQRLILFLRYYGDLDYRTISEATGVRIGTVGAELHAAHRSLRRRLEEVPHL